MAESKVQTKPLRNVAISGGTHGNELLGIYLVRHWSTNDTSIKRTSFKSHVHLNNTQAIEKCVRYIDTDLNRVFTKDGIINADASNQCYEVTRAHKIQKWASQNSIDHLIDIHDTTSNTGAVLILTPTTSEDMLTLQIVAKVKDSFDFPVRVFSIRPSTERDSKGQSSGAGITELIGSGMGLENGPVSHGTIKAEMFQQTEKIVQTLLDTIEEFNNGVELNAQELETFEFRGFQRYPRDDNGNITGLIHSAIDGKDWEPIKKGDPLFMTFDGHVINYEEDKETIPIFINEAAYVEKDMAFAKVERVVVKLQPVQKV